MYRRVGELASPLPAGGAEHGRTHGTATWQLSPHAADFFDVEHYPYITFKSKRVIMRDANHGQLIGDLTIRNITREVVLEGEDAGVSQTPWNTFSAGFNLRGR